MQNALPYQIVCLCIYSLLLGCQRPASKVEALNMQEVQIEDQNGWLLTIAEDGSGSLSCASLRHRIVRWPAGTFPFEQVRLLPAFEPKVQEQYPFRWTYRHTMADEIRQYGLPDTSWAARWFVLAHNALLDTPAASGAPRELRRQWQMAPPVGVRTK